MISRVQHKQKNVSWTRRCIQNRSSVNNNDRNIVTEYPNFRSQVMDLLRKFGPTYCDLPTMVDNVAFLLRMSIVNIEKKYTQSIPTVFYVIQILTGLNYFYVFQASMLWFVFVRCQETKDLVAASVIFSLGACSVTGIAKLIYMRCHNDAVKNIVEEYLQYDASVHTGTRFYANLLKALGHVKNRALGFWLFLTINGLLYIAIAIILPGRHFVEDLYVIYGLEPMFETPNYQIAFSMMSAGMYFGIPAETNTSAFLTILTGYVESQMLALSKELDNLWEDANASFDVDSNSNECNNKDVIVNKRIRKLLRDIVSKHRISINLLGQVEKIFREAMAIEFGFLTLGLIAELLGGLENTYMQLPYTLIQVAMDCFIGQRLIDASLALTNAVYNCKWENFDILNQKTVYLMLLNSQKTLTLSVGGLTVLSFSTLMSVLNSIYSAYTTLRSRM